MPRRRTIDFTSAARRYGVTTRTCRRWHAAGADLDRPESVADHLLRQRSPAPRAMRAAHKLITSNKSIHETDASKHK